MRYSADRVSGNLCTGLLTGWMMRILGCGGKMKKDHSMETISTLLGIGTHIDGILEFRDTIRLDGHVKGKIVSASGTLIIGEKATVNADISVSVAVISGEVNGKVDAKDRIEIHRPARVTGDLSANVICIDSGVIFNGNCSMKKLPPAGIVNEPPSKKTPT
jgi:cytoskeletal protein CcmA (bactofilin family)